jgi:uncharacterized damage-inducible protein DinB
MTVANQAIVESVAEKVMETIERTDHLVSFVPAAGLSGRPEFAGGQPNASDLGHLLAHLVDCLSGFCGAFYKAFPAQLADFAELRSMAIPESLSPQEARAKMKLYAVQIERGFRCCTSDDLARRIPTAFVSEGQTLLSILLGNLEHLINHKYQLFSYLKLLGLSVGSRDIYRFREVKGSAGHTTVESE